MYVKLNFSVWLDFIIYMKNTFKILKSIEIFRSYKNYYNFQNRFRIIFEVLRISIVLNNYRLRIVSKLKFKWKKIYL